ncbi:hypothetical protein F5Y08DRAFT_321372 [Xylaria arbuscula]|nr:hypothetical protein F5Y08DRAFT_321372 [Xylaria arbuscula]
MQYAMFVGRYRVVRVRVCLLLPCGLVSYRHQSPSSGKPMACDNLPASSLAQQLCPETAYASPAAAHMAMPNTADQATRQADTTYCSLSILDTASKCYYLQSTTSWPGTSQAPTPTCLVLSTCSTPQT